MKKTLTKEQRLALIMFLNLRGDDDIETMLEMPIAKGNLDKMVKRAMTLYGPKAKVRVFCDGLSLDELRAVFYGVVYNSLYYKPTELTATHRSLMTAKVCSEAVHENISITQLRAVADRAKKIEEATV